MKDTDLRLFAQLSAAPHTFVQRNHRYLGSSQSSIDYDFAASRRVNNAVRVDKCLRDFYILSHLS